MLQRWLCSLHRTCAICGAPVYNDRGFDEQMAKIREQQALSDEIVDELKAAIEDFKSTYNA